MEGETTYLNEEQMAHFHVIHAWDHHLHLMNFLLPPGVCLSIPHFIFFLFFSIQLSSTECACLFLTSFSFYSFPFNCPALVGLALSPIMTVSSERKVMLTMK